MEQDKGKLTERTLKALQKEFVVIGKTHIRAWHAWFILGLAAGAFAGIVFVANRSLELESIAARTPNFLQAAMFTGVIVTPDGTQEFIQPQIHSGEAQKFIYQFTKDPFRFLTPIQRERVSKKIARFVALPKSNISSRTADTLTREAKFYGAKNIKPIKYSKKQGVFSFEIEDQTNLNLLRQEFPGVEILSDRLVFLQGPIVPFKFAPQAFAQSPEEFPVTVGVVDTGVDQSTFGASYSPGPETTSFNHFFQPWHNSRSFPINVPPEGGWLNITAFWPATFGSLPSPVDLDLILRDESGQEVARSETRGSIPMSERIEIELPPQGSPQTFEAELTLYGNDNPRVIPQYVNVYQADIWHPSFTPQVEAGKFPRTLDILLGEELTERPPGALPSHTGSWKKGSFTLLGKQYSIVMSDFYPDILCGEMILPNQTHYFYVFHGYDAISLDLDGDGDFGDVVAKGSPCDPSYRPPFLSIEGVQYVLNEHYFVYYIVSGVYEERPYTDRYPYLTSFNDKIASLSLLSVLAIQGSIYGPRDTTEDFLGHGTHVAGIVNQVAPTATIYNAKVFGNALGGGVCGSTAGVNGHVLCRQTVGAFESEVVSGIQGAIDNGASVINLSLGADYAPPTRCEDFLMSRFIKEVIVNRGVTVVASAGNRGPANRTIGAPACVEEVITVGAVRTTDPTKVTNYSSRGQTHEGIMKPDLVAIGGDDGRLSPPYPDHIAFTVPGGVASYESSKLWSFFGITNRVEPDRIKMSGTSMAAPQVSGAVARILARRPDLTPAQIKSLLMETARDLGLPREAQGAGLLDLQKALESLE